MADPERFTPEEALPPRSLGKLPPSLCLSNNRPINYKVALIRLLSGTANIRCNYKNLVIKQRNNYSKILFSRNNRISKKTVADVVSPYRLRDLDTYISKSGTNNRIFYKELFVEFSNFFLKTQQNQQVTAFLHLYRILESAAYCFPLIWASRAKDYTGTFNTLKKYFNEQKTGELGVFNRFLDDIIDTNLFNTTIQLNILSVHPKWQEKYFASLIKNIDKNDITSLIEFSQITIKCHCLISLMINLRNQYFHFLTGQGHNLNSDDIAEPNEFFIIVNGVMANWLAQIFFTIIDYEMSTIL